MKRFLTGMVFLCGIAFSIHSQMETKEYSAIKECEQGKEQIVIKSTPEKALVYINNEYREDKISIRITVPGVDTLPVSTEIELPLDVIKGQR